MKRDMIRILGALMVAFSLVFLARLAFRDFKLIGLTPEKCTGEVTGYIVDTVYGSKMRYGGTSHSQHENFYDVYYDVIEYEVDGKIYKITSRHAQSGEPVIGAQTQVHYNPKNPAKAYDNSPPYFSGIEYFYPAMIALMGIALFFRLDKLLKR